MGDWIGSAGEAIGDGVEWAGNKAADGLEQMGGGAVSEAIRDGSEWTADRLGAEVSERELGTTEDPKELIHGEVKELTETAEHLRDFFRAFERMGTGMRGLDAGSWRGEAGEKFREKFEPQPKFWIKAADACESAAKALVTYASTVEWAQDQAREAIAAYKKAKDTSEKAVTAYNKRADTWNRVNESGGDPGPRPEPFSDPGKEGMTRAQHLLSEARRQRDSAARDAQQTMSRLVRDAPAEPGLMDQLKAGARDANEAMSFNTMHALSGAAQGLVGTLQLARTLDPMNPYNLTHPGEYAKNVNGVLTGLAATAAHPERIVSAVKNANWRDPGEIVGKVLVELIGGKGAGGAVKGGLKGGLKTGAKQGLKEGAEQGARKTVKERLKDLGRQLNCKVLRNEPVDMATGRMVLQETDVSLPGSFPLAFTRTFESAYRLGGWFGAAWASPLDERLEIDSEGVVYVAADGSVRAYPHPAPGVPVIPREGLPWPLDRAVDGSYTLTDPVTGLVRGFSAPEDAPPGGDGIARIAALAHDSGGWASFEWDADAGTPLSVSHSGGYELTFTCDGERVTALHLAGAAADGSGQLLKSYDYDEAGHLVAVADSTGAALRYGVDEHGRIVSWTDSNDRSFSYTYDQEDRCVFHTGEAGHLRATFEYRLPSDVPGHHVTRVTDSLGHRQHFLVDSRLRIVAETDANGHTTRTTYDARHRPLTVTDPLGGTVEYTYDDDGRTLRVVLPDGGEVAVDYDESGRPVRRIAADGAEWHYARDERGLVTAATDPAGATTTYGYDDRGHLASVTDASGATSRVRCDRAGLPLSVTDPSPASGRGSPNGGTTTYVRDALGRPVTLADPSGATTRLSWTPEGRLVRREDPDGAVESWTYDGEGNCLTHTDAVGGETRYEYTHFDLRTARTDPDGVRHTFAYDTELRLVGVTSPQGLTWNYTYDAAGRLISETDFDDRTVQYGHDSTGGLAFRTNPAGQTVSFTRDAMGRITRKNADGDATDFTYDAGGRLISATGPDADLVCRRDKLGRIKTEAVGGRVLSHDYDALGRRTRRTTPSGTVTTYGYDAAGNRTSLTTNGHTVAFDHDEAGRETVRRIGGGELAFTSLWDPAGRLASQTVHGPTVGTVQQRSYSYRPDSHLIGVEDQLNGPQRFALDRVGRVTAVTAEDWSESYAYDEAGNQTSADWPAQHASSDARGHRSYAGTKLLSAGSVRYEYDDAGRAVLRQKSRLSKKPDTWRYAWDGEDHLTSVTTPDGSRWRYLYDPLGRRTAKQRLSPDGEQVLEQVDFTWDGSTLIEQTTAAPGLPDPVTLTWD
ncbi:type IV secretion protein Rhs, partial [Streptomyces nanshensis]